MTETNKTPQTQGEPTITPTPQPTSQGNTNTPQSVPNQGQQVNQSSTTTPSTQPTPAGQTTPTGQKVFIRTPMQKRGSKISPKAFAIGCIGFVALLVLVIFVGVYYALQNPAALARIGIPASQAKSILMIIAGAFFGILFFGSFASLGISGYRLSKAKNTPKGKYIIGLIISFIVLTISLGLGAVVLTRISKINTENLYSKNLVVGFVRVFQKGSTTPQRVEIESPYVAAIAPINVYMKINSTFRAMLGSRLGNNNATSLVLSCGNGDTKKPSTQIGGSTILRTDSTATEFFDGPCLYTKKGTYNLEVIYTYFDTVSQQTKTDKFPVGTINLRAEIALTNNGTRLTTNDNNTEILAGDTPARLIFDAKNIFTDLGLKDNLIAWDLNGDGIDETEKENKSFFSYNYTQAGLYAVRFRLPGSNSPTSYYDFPLRLLQSDVPICTISQKAGSNGSLTFQGTWDDNSKEVSKMQFEVYNITKEQTVQTLPTTNPVFTYTLPNNDQYVIRLVYTTLDGKKGFCESETLNANKASYDIQATLSWKKPQDTQYTKITATSPEVSIKNDTITTTLAPIDLQIAIDKILPSIPESTTVTAVLDDQSMNAVKANVFSSRIYGPKPQHIKIIIDDGKGNISEKVWTITFNQSALRGSLLAEPVIGVEPLTVSFDASTISTTDTQDQIIYYSWDFGDGKVAKNISYSKMEHTYYFNMSSGQVGYNPTVSVQTKKGVTQTFTLSTPISVQRKASNITITIPSHPTQIANVGESVTFKMNTDGYVTSTTWNFGDGSSEQQCDFRSCEQISHTFTSAGTYTIRVTADYEGLPSTSTTINMKVE